MAKKIQSMIPGSIFKWVLYISSYIPICAMIFLKNLKSFSKKEIIKTWNSNVNFWIILIALSVLSFLVLIGWLILLKCLSKQRNSSVEVKEYTLKDSEVLNFFVTYIIPILSLNPKSQPSVVMNMFLVIIEGIYFVNNNAVYYNVMLILMGYHIFSFDEENIIITRLSKADLVFDEKNAKQIGTTNIYYI